MPEGLGEANPNDPNNSPPPPPSPPAAFFPHPASGRWVIRRGGPPQGFKQGSGSSPTMHPIPTKYSIVCARLEFIRCVYACLIIIIIIIVIIISIRTIIFIILSFFI